MGGDRVKEICAGHQVYLLVKKQQLPRDAHVNEADEQDQQDDLSSLSFCFLMSCYDFGRF